jgi:hypothetical protein
MRGRNVRILGRFRVELIARRRVYRHTHGHTVRGRLQSGANRARGSGAVTARVAMGLPTTDEAIRAAEDELGRRLPPSLRDRLLKNNGGDIVVRLSGEEDEHWELHPVWDPANRDTMQRSANHLVAEQGSARGWPRFPPDAVAITTADGDQLVLPPGEDDPQLWFHETGDLERVEVVRDP